MGLCTTHDCWHGGYGTFGIWRSAVAKAAGIPDLYAMDGFRGNISWESLKPDPLHELLNHSDCDGCIQWESCKAIAERLEELVEHVEDAQGAWPVDTWREKTRQFAKGLRLAYSLEEDVEFL